MRPLKLASSAARDALERAGHLRSVATSLSGTRMISARRAFSSFPFLRPSILPSSGTVFRAPNNISSTLPVTSATTSSSSTAEATTTTIPDIVPRSSITSHPALAGAGVQIRCGPRPTMARTSRLIRKRRHGFLSRIRTRNGRRLLQRRKDKKRSVLSM